jgi:DNA-directed RNA polymerase subunit F
MSSLKIERTAMITPMECDESLRELRELRELLEKVIQRMDRANQRLGSTCRNQLEMKFFEVVNTGQLSQARKSQKNYLWVVLTNEAKRYFKTFLKWDAEAQRSKWEELDCYEAPNVKMELSVDYLEFLEKLSPIETLACQTLTDEISVAQATQIARVSSKYIYAVRKRLMTRAARHFRSYSNEHN